MTKKRLSLFQPIDLTEGTCWKTIFLFSIPIIISYLLQQIYTISDAAIVGQTLAADEVAGVNDTSPIAFIFLQFAFGVSAGFCAVTARSVGAHDEAAVRRSLATQIVLSAALTVALTALALVLLNPMLAWINLTPASGEVYRAAFTYCAIIFAGIGAQLFYNFICSFLRSLGDSVTPLLFLLFSTALNVGLDLLFIVTFRWGVAGAAIATGLSQCVGGLFPLLYFLRPNTSKLLLVRTKLELQPILNACGNGSSELMSNISSSIVSMVYNFQLLKYLGEDGVSAYGVLMYVQFVFVAIYIGYSIGCAPIVGFHYGAQNHPELKNMLRMSVILMSASGVVLTVLARVLAAPLAKIFVGYDEGLFTLTCHAFRLFSFAFLFAGFNIFASSFFTALGNGLISATISFLRTLVFQTSSVILLPLLLGVDGIWYAITAAEIFATLISIIFLLAKRRKYHYM